MQNEKLTETIDESLETGAETETVETKEEPISYTQEELDKKIQSATDRVRTDYSKRIKDLEAKIKELTPVEKSEKEIELEKRIADIEAREAAINLRDRLSAKGIDNELSSYLKADVDVDALASVLDRYASDRVRVNGFKPNGHKNGESMSREDFAKLSYVQKEQIYRENPELYKHLTGR